MTQNSKKSLLRSVRSMAWNENLSQFNGPFDFDVDPDF
jgi:hypothetical protein